MTPSYVCSPHEYTIELLSFDPLIIYINNFLKDDEVNYILEASEADFDQSWVYDPVTLKSYIDRNYRTSTSATIPIHDAVADCVSQRMKSFLGNVQHIHTESIQVVKYEVGERFRLHMDWFDKPRNKSTEESRPDRPYNRLGSIFAYLRDDCTGGETYFPEVRGVSSDADGSKFTRTDTGMGLLVKPKRGSAVFWNNLFPNGSGDPRVVHAGLPVSAGTKVGINLFSYYYLDAPMVGGSED
ncbi:2OG-Fe(II) oxygenase family oxidoreductase [Immersiella caudata]|uniref:2OG-Fe(II) oxygenase family oxidoreductase n=1 Tax=Immersiella caudata TaxID=314043 RepID=A0AA39WSZ4_9PEZI|nr:2OG-Fe(II) oxygenase family oxidoreductase [Immersiella caudata]